MMMRLLETAARSRLKATCSSHKKNQAAAWTERDASVAVFQRHLLPMFIRPVMLPLPPFISVRGALRCRPNKSALEVSKSTSFTLSWTPNFFPNLTSPLPLPEPCGTSGGAACAPLMGPLLPTWFRVFGPVQQSATTVANSRDNSQTHGDMQAQR